MKAFAQFLIDTQEEMKEFNVEILLPTTSHVKLPDGMECNGYFADKPSLKFACGCGKDIDLWAPIYIHEYCHFTQWRDGIPEWTNLTIDGLYYDDFLDQWLGAGKEFPTEIIHKFINAGITIESDCERRVIKIIEETGMNIDVGEYAQKANAYVHFYNYIRDFRKWYIPGQEPYNIKEVWSQFNKTIDDEFLLSYEYQDLYRLHCFNADAATIT